MFVNRNRRATTAQPRSLPCPARWDLKRKARSREEYGLLHGGRHRLTDRAQIMLFTRELHHVAQSQDANERLLVEPLNQALDVDAIAGFKLPPAELMVFPVMVGAHGNCICVTRFLAESASSAVRRFCSAAATGHHAGQRPDPGQVLGIFHRARAVRVIDRPRDWNAAHF